MRTYIKTAIQLLKQKGLLLGGLGLIIGISTTTAAFAAIPDNHGVIYACRNNTSGAVRIIDNASASCSGTETSLNWNTASSGQLVSNLVGADFTNTSLSYRNLAGQDIHGGTFTGSVLNGADLSSANLSSSVMGPVGTTILARNAHFTNANMNGIEIFGIIDLSGATLAGATLNGSSFAQGSTTIGGDFTAANLTNSQLLGTFSGSNFADVDFATLANYDAIFNNSANLTGALFTGITLGANTQFYDANLTNADFTGATIYSYFRNATIANTNFTNAHFINADLQSVNYSGGIFTGTTWTDTWCPDATFSGNNGNTCIGHLSQ